LPPSPSPSPSPSSSPLPITTPHLSQRNSFHSRSRTRSSHSCLGGGVCSQARVSTSTPC
uniref:Ovule protein n=1 Tax=Hymenolepis diminuta TaxID=6216 RepID=A0A0R3SZS4_HYMDI